MVAGTYWIGLQADGGVRVAYQAGTGSTKFKNGDAYADGPDPTWGAASSTYSMEMSVYAEYSVP